MTPEDKKLWTDALLSGKYPQTTEKLLDSEGFCCLGVACAVFGLDPVYNDHETLCFEGESTVLPKSITNRLGISESGKLKKSVTFTDSLGETTSVEHLAGLNDLGADFKLIAKVIEEQF